MVCGLGLTDDFISRMYVCVMGSSYSLLGLWLIGWMRAVSFICPAVRQYTECRMLMRCNCVRGKMERERETSAQCAGGRA